MSIFTPNSKNLTWFLFLFSLLSFHTIQASGDPASAVFTLDQCISFYTDGSNRDFSEFTADITNTDDVTITVLGDHLFRNNPDMNGHSCTPGIDGTEAMCVSSNTSCDFKPNADRAVRFNIMVQVAPGQTGTLSGLSFHELAPEMFQWIDGASGVNNYPTLYGLRIFKDNNLIYESTDNPTTQDWSLEQFNFNSFDFQVTGISLFSFELLAYCPVGASSLQNIWDLDQIEVEVSSNGSSINGGTITGGPFEFCAGDGVADNIPAGSITLTGNTGPNSQWVVTDDQGIILGLPPMPSVVDFDVAGAGACLIWHLSFEDGLTGATPGNSALTDLVGCYSLSNSITVTRNQPEGGTITGGPFEFCAGDGVADNIPAGSITLAGNSGTNSQWVVTDDQGIILGLPPMPSAVDFDGAGVGACLVWHLSFEDGLTGAAMGNNALTDLAGCYSLSNSITVTRTDCAAPISGGTLAGGPFEFCVGDGVADNLAVGAITVSGNTGTNNQWVVTDPQGNILGLPPVPSAVDFDGAGPGACLVWNLSFEAGLTGLVPGNNVSVLAGTFSFSNSITVNRNQPDGGTIAGGPFSFCAGDGVADNIQAGGIVLAGNTGTNSQWVVTDSQGIILGLPPTPFDVDFDGAGVGACLVWHLSFEDGLTGAMMGNNALTDLVGCYNLSNSITVTRTDCSTPLSGGTLTGGPFEFCVGDGVADNLAPGSITLSGNAGTNSQWVVTDDQGMILGLPPMPSAVDFDGAGAGACLVWNLSYEDGLTGLMMGNNVSALMGAFAFSNSITVNRTQPEGGTIAGGPFVFCVGDGMPDNIPALGIGLTGNSGTNSQWVVTDDQGMILGLPPMPSAVDFDGAGVGACLVWHLSFEDGLTGAEMGNNALTDLVGCYSLSNSITVTRNDCSMPTMDSIVINEINDNGQIELKNVGTTTIDISSYWLCNFPGYNELSTLNIICGTDLILDPNELVTVEVNFNVDSADGELGLYNAPSYSSPTAIVDYVEWGSTGHNRSSVAVSAGIWTTGDFVPSFTAPMSIEYDGVGNSSTDWSMDMATPCVDNLFTPSGSEIFITKTFPNPSTNHIYLEFSRIPDEDATYKLIDRFGNVVATSDMNLLDLSENGLDVSTLPEGLYFIQIASRSMLKTTSFIKI